MKTILKIYSACCLIIVGFFVFFSIPFGLLPFSDGVNLMVAGGLILLVPGIHLIYTLRREAFDLGEYLARRGGFWMIVAAAFGLIAIGAGALVYAAPDSFIPAFENGALPFGMLLVSLFWIALVILMAFPAFSFIAIIAENVRSFRFKGIFFSLFIAFVCLGLSAVFVSLYLEVINDIAIRISQESQWRVIWIFVGAMLVSGTMYGLMKRPATD
jgi:uncharacterized membrane protein